MSLIFERIVTDGIAAVSYLIGDDEEGTAAVIDPRPDVEVYLELARKSGVSITHVFETHIHADLVSGSTAPSATKSFSILTISGPSARPSSITPSPRRRPSRRTTSG
jgi:glyoxylase-like metal-dependent hydrolase (beta-lactamase superfamily II)